MDQGHLEGFLPQQGLPKKNSKEQLSQFALVKQSLSRVEFQAWRSAAGNAHAAICDPHGRPVLVLLSELLPFTDLITSEEREESKSTERLFCTKMGHTHTFYRFGGLNLTWRGVP